MGCISINKKLCRQYIAFGRIIQKLFASLPMARALGLAVSQRWGTGHPLLSHHLPDEEIDGNRHIQSQFL